MRIKLEWILTCLLTIVELFFLYRVFVLDDTIDIILIVIGAFGCSILYGYIVEGLK